MPDRPNRRIIVQEIVSHDGFVADASGGLDFLEVVSDPESTWQITPRRVDRHRAGGRAGRGPRR